MTPIRWRSRVRGDIGSASLWVLVGGLLVLGIAVMVTTRASVIAARHRAESAADLAALAAADGIGVDVDSAAMCRRAERIAWRNGASMRSCSVDVSADGRSGTVVVQVELQVRLPTVGDTRVTARARAGRLPVDTTDRPSVSSEPAPTRGAPWRPGLPMAHPGPHPAGQPSPRISRSATGDVAVDACPSGDTLPRKSPRRSSDRNAGLRCRCAARTRRFPL